MKIEHLKNLGPKSSRWLQEIGIHTKKDLQKIGVVNAYIILKKKEPKVSLNLLWALLAALLDWHHTEIPPEMKKRLKEEVQKSSII